MRRAATNAAIRFAGPRASAPATTTKSQYGHSETQNGTWTYSATGGARLDRLGRRERLDRATGRAGHWSWLDESRTPMTFQPSGTGRRRSMSSVSRPRSAGWPAWPGREEHGEAGDGVAEERRPDAAGVERHPAAAEADDEHQHEHVAVAPGRRDARRQRVDEGLDDVRVVPSIPMYTR